MTFAAPEAIASGMPYRIIHLHGHRTFVVADFVGDNSFLAHRHGQDSVVSGTGVFDDAGATVRFYQKDVGNDGKDVRVWRIKILPGNQLVAEHEAAM